jgi:hypothetical protein
MRDVHFSRKHRLIPVNELPSISMLQCIVNSLCYYSTGVEKISQTCCNKRGAKVKLIENSM